MTPDVFFFIVAGVGIIYGSCVAVFSKGFSRVGKATQNRTWGPWAGARITPGYTRFIGIGMVVIGIIVLVVAIANLPH